MLMLIKLLFWRLCHCDISRYCFYFNMKSIDIFLNDLPTIQFQEHIRIKNEVIPINNPIFELPVNFITIPLFCEFNTRSQDQFSVPIAEQFNLFYKFSIKRQG